MNRGKTTFRTSLRITVSLLVISSLGRGAPQGSPPPSYGLCTTPPCVHSASELLEWRNSEVDPCDDFYEFACGNYGRNRIIGSAHSSWNQFTYTQQHVDTASKEILSQPASSDEPAAVRKAKDAYQACMDEATISQKGTTPLLNILDTFGGWPVLSKGFKGKECSSSKFNWTEIGRATSQLGIWMIFNNTVNFRNSSQMVINVLHDSLPLPEPLQPSGKIEPSESLPWDYFGDQNIRGKAPAAPVVDLYERYLTRMVKNIWDSRPSSELNDYPNRDDVEKSIEMELRNVTQFMQNLKLSKYIDDSSNISKRIHETGLKTAYGLMTVATLQNYTDTIFPNPKYKLDWLDYLQKLFVHSNITFTSKDRLLVESVDELMKAIYVVETTDERTLQNFIGSRIVSYLAPETTDDLWQTAKYQELKHIKGDYSRWMHCYQIVSNYPEIRLGMAVAYKYKENYFDNEKIEQVRQMVIDLKEAFNNLTMENDWMDNKTKANAMEKADAMLLLLGFPDWLSDRKKLDAFYQNLTIDSYDHFGNVVRLRSFEFSQGLKAFRNVNRNTWTETPLIVNAFYSHDENSIQFPAGILNRPFYYGSDVEALDYGRIGSIIGHEITHGFDSIGRNYDKNGIFTNWWTPAVDEKYNAKAQCFIEQYNNFTDPYTNKTVNGQLTLRENIADNGGLQEAYRAFTQKMLPRREKNVTDMQNNTNCVPKSGTRLPGLEQYTEDQLFFLGFATAFCEVERPTQAQATYDNHAPHKFRVQGSLSNMEEFAKAWSCPEGRRMNPKKKCVLW